MNENRMFWCVVAVIVLAIVSPFIALRFWL